MEPVEKVEHKNRMKRFLRHISIFVVLSVFVTAVRYPYSSIADGFIADIKTQAAKQKIYTEIGAVDVNFPGYVEAKNVNLLLPANPLPLPLAIESISADASILSLLIATLSVNGEIDAYKGSGNFSYSYPFLGSSQTFKARLRDLALEEHPIPAGYGISGLISLDAEGGLRLESGLAVLEKTKFSAQITNAEYIGGHKIQGILQLPAAAEIDLRVSGDAESKNIVFDELELLSTLGTISGNGGITHNAQGKIDEMNFNLDLKLTTQGVESFSGYLALAARLPVDSRKKRWKIKIQKKPGRSPQTLITAN